MGITLIIIAASYPVLVTSTDRSGFDAALWFRHVVVIVFGVGQWPPVSRFKVGGEMSEQ